MPETSPEIERAIQLAVDLRRGGASPSAIVLALRSTGMPIGIQMMLVGLRAFGLSIPEMKEGAVFVSEDGFRDRAAFDAFFEPLMRSGDTRPR